MKDKIKKLCSDISSEYSKLLLNLAQGTVTGRHLGKWTILIQDQTNLQFDNFG